jgi:hypothetical protein
VRAWQVWNEPNLAIDWEPSPNLGAYVALLRATYHAIKRLDARAIVVSAGMPFTSAAQASSTLAHMYRLGARNVFDALAVHAYSATVSGAIARLVAARNVMNRFGDTHKPLWLTEWGWAGGPPDPYQVSAAGQRTMIGQFLAEVARNRRRLGLRETFYWQWRDWIYGPQPSWWGYHTGFFTTGLKPKLALPVFSRAAGSLNR